MTQHLSIRVTGKVQGVFYRASAKDVADALGVKGFVRNEPEGSVYIEAEGTTDQLKNLVSWCKEGPPRAKVDEVEVVPGEVKGFDRFEVRR